MKQKLLLPLFVVACLFFTGKSVQSQRIVDTLAFQDFELIPAPPVWNFTGPVIYNSGFSSPSAAPPNSALGIGGSRAWETTTNSGGLTLEFDNIAIPSGYDSIRVHFNLAAMNLLGSSGGPDNLDYVLVQYSTDGGFTYVSRLRIRGAVADNSFWGYNATGIAAVYNLPALETMFQPLTSGLQSTMGYSYCEIHFDGTAITQLKVRIIARSSSSTDTWLIDHVALTGVKLCTESTSFISPVACGAYTSPSGNVYTSGGTYMDTIPNVAGCDSVITIDLTVNPLPTAMINPVSCGAYTSPAGNVYTTGGTYTDTIPNISGCDSVITINLTVNDASAATINPVSCGAYTSPAGNIYTANGTYTDIIPNTSGCDSVITIHLTVNTVDVSVAQSGAVLTAIAAGAVYQWMDCGNQQPVTGENAQSFTPVVNGVYAVIVTQNGCTDTSVCYTVGGLSTSENAFAQQLFMYPNPTTGNVNIKLNGFFEQITVEIINILGEVVQSQNYTQTNWINMDVHVVPGVYFMRVTNKTGENALMKFTRL